MQIPIVSRLSWDDYKRLLLAVSILVIESYLRFLTWLLPVSIMDFLRFRVVRIIPRVFQGYHDEDIREAKDRIGEATTAELINIHGYECEEHLVVTTDGYILLLHRILPGEKYRSRQTTSSTIFPSPASSVATAANRSGPPILVIHGAMLSSEIWVCQKATDKNLVFNLVDEGYDVWLANRRGTKYSQKHVYYKSSDIRFWDYSLDETIMHDVPAQVEHILSISGHKTISLAGFSQGTAETFGALSFNRKLQKRVNCVVALSATAKPPTPSNSLILSMVHWSPELVFLLFGRKSMLRSVLFWMDVLSPRALAWGMDMAMFMLFRWTNRNIRPRDRPLLYRHLFALSSVKQIVHWFQIMRAGRFQMFDDSPSRTHIVPEYPLRNIKVPSIIFIGDQDCLIDEGFVTNNLLTATVHKMPGYEHMDTIWSHDANVLVFPHIIEFLKFHRSPHQKLRSNGPPPSQLAWPPQTISVQSALESQQIIRREDPTRSSLEL